MLGAERAETSYAWRSLRDEGGAILVGGSDAPVGDPLILCVRGCLGEVARNPFLLLLNCFACTPAKQYLHTINHDGGTTTFLRWRHVCLCGGWPRRWRTRCTRRVRVCPWPTRSPCTPPTPPSPAARSGTAGHRRGSPRGLRHLGRAGRAVVVQQDGNLERFYELILFDSIHWVNIPVQRHVLDFENGCHWCNYGFKS